MSLINKMLINPKKIKDFLPIRSFKAFKRYKEITK